MRKFFGLFVSLLLVLLISGPSAMAEDTSAATSSDDTSTQTVINIGEVRVSETRKYFGSEDLPATVDVIGEDVMNYSTLNSSYEIVKRLPGFYYARYNEGVNQGNPGMRGFKPGEQFMPLIVDGIPWIRGTGAVNMEPFFALEIDRMELVRGTIDPRWGVSNIAGNMNVHTKRGGNRTEGKFLYGSFGTAEGNALVAREKDGFSQTYFAGYKTTDGYRDHSKGEKGSVSGKWFYTADGGDLSAGIIARHFEWVADTPGYLNKELAAQDPTQMMVDAGTDGGESEDNHISAHLDWDLATHLHWSFKTYVQKMVKDYWSSWRPNYMQGERYTEDSQFGALSKLYYETEEFGIKKLKLEWGLDFQNSDNIHNRYRPTNNRVRGPWRVYNGLPWNFEYSRNNWGSYVSANAAVNDWFRMMAGLRMDRFDGELEIPAANLKYDMLDMDTIWQPKVGVVVTPVKNYNLYANWGRSFQLPSEQDLFTIPSTSPGTSYSTNDGWEIGTRCSPTKWFAFRVAYWEMTASDEVKWIAALNWRDNIGETERKGWDFSVNLDPLDWLSTWGSVTLQEGKFIEGITAASRGKSMDRVPSYTAKAGVDIRLPYNTTASLWLDAQDDYWIDSQNLKGQDGGYNLVNMRLAHTRGAFTYALDVENLFDEEWYCSVWNSSSGYGYSPGDALAAYASVSFKF